MMRDFALLAILILLSGVASGQEKFTISGHVRDASSGEELIGASVHVNQLKTGTSANLYGFYSLTIPAGDYTIRCSMMGYDTKETGVSLTESITRNIELSVKPILLDPTSVTARAADENLRKVDMGSLELRLDKVRDMPVIFGEQDIMKTIQLKPGVNPGREGEAGFSVRGGGADQNLVLLDEAVVYNTSHLLGFFSVFNSDAIKDVKLIKGTASSEYGGRLSSVLDLKMKEGNIKELSAVGGIGLISSRFTLQSPIVKDRGSFMVSGRRTYFDLFMKLSSDDDIKNSTMYFYDLNLKTNYRLGNNDRVFLSGYFGRDVFAYTDEFGVDWGNKTATLRWNHIFGDQLFLNSSLIYSTYDYLIGITYSGELIDISSSIVDVNLKEDFQYFITPRHTLKFGLNTTYHTFHPGRISAKQEKFVNELELRTKRALETALYINHEYELSPLLTVNYGLRHSGFGIYGPDMVYDFDDAGFPTDSTEYESRELIKYYGGLEPRLAVNYVLNDHSSAKFSYARNRQYLHLLSASTSTTPFDNWLPSTNIVQPGTADQVSLGYFRNFDDNGYETSFEVYYKDFRNQIAYRGGADIFLNPYVEAELVFGRGWSYGAEFMVERKFGKLNGWLSYTLSKTMRQFDEINDGTAFPARQDRTHDISVVGLYDVSSKWTIAATWVYSTGNAVTFPSGKYEVDDHTVNLYSDRNASRMPAYHRLDVAFTYKKQRSSWNFSLYNAYGRRNAYAINFRKNEDDPTRTEAVRLSLFSFFPSITYNFKW